MRCKASFLNRSARRLSAFVSATSVELSLPRRRELVAQVEINVDVGHDEIGEERTESEAAENGERRPAHVEERAAGEGKAAGQNDRQKQRQDGDGAERHRQRFVQQHAAKM